MHPSFLAIGSQVVMGNASSQLRPTSPGLIPSQQYAQNDAAASAQLLAESSSAQQTIATSYPDDGTGSSGSPVQLGDKQGRQKSKPRLSESEVSSDAGNIQAKQHEFSYGLDTRFVDAEQENGNVGGGLGKPRSSYSLDEIDENDEGVSSLFQEYESHATLPAFDLVGPPQDTNGSPAIFFEPLTGETLVNQQSGAAPSELDRGTKRNQGESYSHTSCSNSSQLNEDMQEPWNGTGQHAFELDFEAFDKIFANGDTHQANPFSDESGYDIPHGTELFQDMYQTHVDMPPQSDMDVAGVIQPQGKLPRVTYAGRRKKRRRMEVPNSLDSQTPLYISPYATNEGHQDRVLPGFEDTQGRSSPEIPYSQPPGLSHGTSCPSSGAPRTETPPARLKQPSKPRGNKKQRGGKKGHNYRPPLQELSDKGGMFRDDEIKVLEQFCKWYCEEEGISRRRFNELIHSDVRGRYDVKRMFNAMYDELPYRTHQSILRFCRRHFHNFAVRGAWTAADDANLRDAIAKKGRSWKAVGAILDRFPEDCRDRYRNYIVNSDKRNTETWTEHETHNLVKAVDDCMGLLQRERARAKEEKYEGREVPESELESDQEVQDLKLINWQIVSDRMGGTRSRLQCAYKFNHLKKEDRDYYIGAIRRLAAGKDCTAKAHADNSHRWRLKRSMRKLRNMRTGDKYDFLQLFANCAAASESNILWRSLGGKAFRKRWSTMDMKAALEIFKQQVPGSERMSYQEIINRVYTRLMTENSSDFDNRWDPEAHGDINEFEKESLKRTDSPPEMPQRDPRQGSEQRRGRYRKPKSTMFVNFNDVDEEEEEEEEEGKDVENAEASENVTQTAAEYDGKDNDDPADSLEEGMSKEQDPGEAQVPDIVESSDEGMEPRRSRSFPSSMADNSIPNTGPSTVTGSTNQTSNSSPASDSGSNDDSDTDDSLFNGGSGDELVERLQSLRDA